MTSAWIALIMNVLSGTRSAAASLAAALCSPVASRIVVSTRGMSDLMPGWYQAGRSVVACAVGLPASYHHAYLHFVIIRLPPRHTHFPYSTLFRSRAAQH